MLRVPELLSDNARALVAGSTFDVWRSTDGSVRVLGPMNRPFDNLYVMLLGGSEAGERIRRFLDGSEQLPRMGFLVVSDLTEEVGVPALLIERVSEASPPL